LIFEELCDKRLLNPCVIPETTWFLLAFLSDHDAGPSDGRQVLLHQQRNPGAAWIPPCIFAVTEQKGFRKSETEGKTRSLLRVVVCNC
jgi:hypothetical protein